MTAHPFTKEQEDFLIGAYMRMSLTETIAAFANAYPETPRTVNQIGGLIKRRRVKSGRDTRFRHDQVPWNAGVKRSIKANATSFQSGHRRNAVYPVGTERINSYGYLEIKVAERNPYTGAATRYRMKHIVLWERANGQVPSGHVVVFIDGDKRNCVLDNLACISRAVLVRLNKNGYADLAPELRPAAIALCRLMVRQYELQRDEI